MLYPHFVSPIPPRKNKLSNFHIVGEHVDTLANTQDVHHGRTVEDVAWGGGGEIGKMQKSPKSCLLATHEG